MVAKLVGWTLPDDVLTGYCGEVAVFVEEGAKSLPDVCDNPVSAGCGDAMPVLWGRP